MNLVRLPEAAEVLGVHPKTLRRRITDGVVTGYRLGPRLIYIDIDEVREALLRESTSK